MFKNLDLLTKKRSFVKPYDKEKFIPNAPSVPVQDVFRLKRDENNNSIYIKVGEKNIREYVNSFKNTSALTSILNRISLMPVQDKISYLNQTDCSASADISNIPTDATAAYIFLNKYRDVLPDISKQIKNGASVNDIIKAYFPDNKNSSESEVTENVEA